MSKSEIQGQKRYRRWYENKGEERNERRREKYATSPKARKVNRQRSKEWRDNQQAGAAPVREFYRFVDGKRVRVWTTGQIAIKAGVSPQSLRLWASQGLLPEPDFPGGHRFYLWATAQKIISFAKKGQR